MPGSCGQIAHAPGYTPSRPFGRLTRIARLPGRKAKAESQTEAKECVKQTKVVRRSTQAGLLLVSGLAYWLVAGEALAGDTKLWHETASNVPHFHPVAADMQQMAAQDEEFWSNVLRYIRYFFSVLLGTAYITIKPIGQLLRKPVTAVLVVVALGGLFVFLRTTLNAMLGMDPSAPLPMNY